MLITSCFNACINPSDFNVSNLAIDFCKCRLCDLKRARNILLQVYKFANVAMPNKAATVIRITYNVNFSNSFVLKINVISKLIVD